jgi:hypothetical protein
MLLIENGVVIQTDIFNQGQTIRSLKTTKHGFAVGGTGGIVNIYDFHIPKENGFNISQTIPLPDPLLVVNCLASSSSEDILLAQVNTNQILKTILNSPDTKQQVNRN